MQFGMFGVILLSCDALKKRVMMIPTMQAGMPTVTTHFGLNCQGTNSEK